jgi:hypothetical protein
MLTTIQLRIIYISVSYLKSVDYNIKIYNVTSCFTRVTHPTGRTQFESV